MPFALRAQQLVVLGQIKITNPATSSCHSAPQPTEQVHLTDPLYQTVTQCSEVRERCFVVPMGALVWVPADI